MGIDQTGKLHTIFDKKQISEKFAKREFVLEIADGKYPQVVLFQLTGDRCDQLNSLKVGDEVKVEYSLRGREWRSPTNELKYFNSLDVWNVELIKGTAAAPSNERPANSYPQTGHGAPGGPEDDLPFAHCDIAHEPSPIARILR